MLKIIKNYKKLSVILVAIIFGVLLYILDLDEYANFLFGIVSLWILIPLAWGMFKDLVGGKYGLDILAVVAVTSSLLMQEYLASIVIVLMIASGKALEDYAQEHAKKELKDLLKRAPTFAHKRVGNDYKDITVDEIKVGDILIVKTGEVIPVDSIVLEGESSVDESALTGESMPIDVRAESHLLSGSVNQQASLLIEATRTSKESQYEQIVNLVAEAASTKSPFVRLADLYSVPFTIVSIIIAALAWIISGESIRALEVLVLATPCPLLIATPVALVSGMSKGARNGVIFKHGAALEKLSKIKMIAFDKTGTLTIGAPSVNEVKSLNTKYTSDEILAAAASASTKSSHTLAAALVREADDKKLVLPEINKVKESVGKGVIADSKIGTIILGKESFIAANNINIATLGFDEINDTLVHVAVDNKYVGYVTFKDTVRHDSKKTLMRLKAMGIKYFAMLTGDKKEVAMTIANKLGITHIHAECLPADKLNYLKRYKIDFEPVAFVGDGINDAPSLAAVDVGIALGAKGSTAASEAADVVIMLDSFAKLADAVQISRRTISIAKQSIFLGIGLSIILMIFAATTGIIKPVYGALLQELVDVIVIFLALRAHY